MSHPLRFVFVTPGTGPAGRVIGLVRAALDGGATAVWVRERRRAAEERDALLREVCALVRRGEGAVILSGDPEVALRFGCDAVHLGFRDASTCDVRTRFGDRIRIGYSAHDPPDPDSVAAADYVTLSPVFRASKPLGPPAMGLPRFRELARQLPVPVLALGGIDEQNANLAIHAGADGVCVLSAIASAPDPRAAAVAIRRALEGGR